MSNPIIILKNTTNNTLPVIMKYSLKDEESIQIPNTIYSNARVSAHSQYASVPSRSPSVDIKSSHSQVQVELYSFADEGGNIMEMTKLDEIQEKIKKSDSKNQVLTACSWTSISGCISVKNPSIGSTLTTASDYYGDHFSSNCDSGYCSILSWAI